MPACCREMHCPLPLQIWSQFLGVVHDPLNGDKQHRRVGIQWRRDLGLLVWQVYHSRTVHAGQREAARGGCTQYPAQ